MAIKIIEHAPHDAAAKQEQPFPLWVCGWSVLLVCTSFYLSGYFIITEFLHLLANL
jgi:hypothetical protein